MSQKTNTTIISKGRQSVNINNNSSTTPHIFKITLLLQAFFNAILTHSTIQLNVTGIHVIHVGRNWGTPERKSVMAIVDRIIQNIRSTKANVHISFFILKSKVKFSQKWTDTTQLVPVVIDVLNNTMQLFLTHRRLFFKSSSLASRTSVGRVLLEIAYTLRNAVIGSNIPVDIFPPTNVTVKPASTLWALYFTMYRLVFYRPEQLVYTGLLFNENMLFYPGVMEQYFEAVVRAVYKKSTLLLRHCMNTIELTKQFTQSSSNIKLNARETNILGQSMRNCKIEDEENTLHAKTWERYFLTPDTFEQLAKTKFLGSSHSFLSSFSISSHTSQPSQQGAIFTQWWTDYPPALQNPTFWKRFIPKDNAEPPVYGAPVKVKSALDNSVSQMTSEGVSEPINHEEQFEAALEKIQLGKIEKRNIDDLIIGAENYGSEIVGLITSL